MLKHKNICVSVQALNSKIMLWSLLDTRSTVNLVRHFVYLKVFAHTALLKINNLLTLREVNIFEIIIFGKI